MSSSSSSVPSSSSSSTASANGSTAPIAATTKASTKEDDEDEKTSKKSSQTRKKSTKPVSLADELTQLQPTLKRTRDRVTAGKKQLLEELRKNHQKTVQDASGEKEYYIEKKAKKPTLKMYHVEAALNENFELTNKEKRRFMESVLRYQINDTPDIEVKLKVKNLKKKKKKVVEPDSESGSDNDDMSDEEQPKKRHKKD